MDFLQNNRSASHSHSLDILWTLAQFHDFMESIDSVIDVGCGDGHDALWWATATDMDEDNPRPLNINVTALDKENSIDSNYELPKNLTFKQGDLYTTEFENRFDVVWSHNILHSTNDPLKFLHKMNEFCTDGGMLGLSFPATSNMFYGDPDYRVYREAPHGITMIHLIYMLVLSGFNCREGYFTKQPGTNIISAIVYKDTDEVFGHGEKPLSEYSELLPVSCQQQLNKYNYLTNKGLLLDWINGATLDYSSF
ncbi:class I SAM-dependent methyltransferase [bacterium]|nr:class I SAM-dependent methyltransferase [bacterium]